jgi:hypothetical protein
MRDEILGDWVARLLIPVVITAAHTRFPLAGGISGTKAEYECERGNADDQSHAG